MSALVRTIRKAILGTAANRNQVLKGALEELGIEAGQSSPHAMLKLQKIILNSGRDSEVQLRRAFTGLNITGGDVGGGEASRIQNALLRSGRESELRAAIDDLISLEGGGPDYEGPLDLVAGAVVAYGQRALSAAMLGEPLYRLRRDSDDAEMTFSSDAETGEAPVAEIVAWLGGSNGFVKTWFDQSGNGKDVTQATAADQPGWSATSINDKPCLTFDSVTEQYLATAAGVSFPNGAFTIVSVQKTGVDTSQAATISANARHTGPDFQYGVVREGGGNIRVVAFADTAAFSSGNGFQATSEISGTDVYSVVDSAWTTASNSCIINGTDIPEPTDFSYGDGNSGACNEIVVIGTNDTSNQNAWLDGELLEVIAYATVKGGSDRTTLRENLATYYDITVS